MISFLILECDFEESCIIVYVQLAQNTWTKKKNIYCDVRKKAGGNVIFIYMF